ncbi:MAG TPA: hypothetical protein VK555_13520 [Terriglobales bacterium]|nr:hypothetical protein [Terriglobales bacterium]
MRSVPTMPKPASSKSDRDLQDKVIRYLADARARNKSSTELPLSPEQARRAEKFGRFLARRYYRDRLARSFRYSRLFASVIGRTAEQVVDGESFQSFLNECVMGSLEAAQRVGQMAGTHLSDVQEPGAWWGELLAYEQAFFLQAAAAETEPAADTPRRRRSAVCRAFRWNLPEILTRLKSAQNIGDDLKKDVLLLFSRTSGGKIYVVELQGSSELVWQHADGFRRVDQIASAVSLPAQTVQDTLQALSQIGAVVLPPK